MKIDINVGVSDVGGEKTFCFRLDPLSREALGRLEPGTPSQVNFSTESVGAKLKDLGKLRLRMVAQMLTGKKRLDVRFRILCGKRMQWRAVSLT
jgi:hypothetical protein